MTIEENICIGLTEKKKKLRVQIEQLINSLGWDINLNELGRIIIDCATTVSRNC